MVPASAATDPESEQKRHHHEDSGDGESIKVHGCLLRFRPLNVSSLPITAFDNRGRKVGNVTSPEQSVSSMSRGFL